MSAKKRTRRTAEQRIADLQEEILKIKERAAEKQAKKDPAVRHITSAIKAIDKGSDATSDAAIRTALSEARATLTACLALKGVVSAAKGSKRGRAAGRPDAGQVLEFIKKHPGTRSVDICEELNTDAMSLRPVLHKLRGEKKVKVAGKARATTYTAR